MYVWMDGLMDGWMDECLCMDHACMYVGLCVYVCVSMCTYVYVSVCACMYVYVNVYIYIYM